MLNFPKSKTCKYNKHHKYQIANENENDKDWKHTENDKEGL